MTKQTMKDVSHTSPYGSDANGVWERGFEHETNNEEAEAIATGDADAPDTPAPADD